MTFDRPDPEPADAPLLTTRALMKLYGRQVAVAPTDFSIDAGEVVAVLGENGAGKSTFTKMLAGVLRPSGGQIIYRGHPVAFRSPRAALTCGLALVPQETSCVPELSVAENLMLGRWPLRRGLVSAARLAVAATNALGRLDLDMDVTRPMSALSIAEAQLVDIARALERAASLVLLDEPTAALGGADVDRLLTAINRLRSHQVGVLFVTHRLGEASAVSDRVVVFRDGHLVQSFSRAEVSRRKLVAALVGEHAETVKPDSIAPARSDATAAAPVLELRRVSSAGREGLRDVGLKMADGEVVGVFGRRGCGANELAEVIVGIQRIAAGEIVVNGRRLPQRRSIRVGLEAGIAYVPPDRAKNGLVLCRSVAENATLLLGSKLSRLGCVRPRASRAVVTETMHAYDVRCQSAAQAIGELSGGNQQKVLIASRLARMPRLAVLHEPTRGVDIGSRSAIHHIIRRAAADGAAVLVVSSDVEEVVELCDRVLVMRDGTIAAELSGTDKTQQAALHLGGGGVAGDAEPLAPASTTAPHSSDGGAHD
jgi:ribose transport system ATP-binding protein